MENEVLEHVTVYADNFNEDEIINFDNNKVVVNKTVIDFYKKLWYYYLAL